MKLKLVVVLEQTPNNYCAYLPDLPGCVSTGSAWEEMIREAVPFHIESMIEHGDPLPEKAMSLEEAMACHSEPIPEDVMERFAQYGGDVPSLSTAFQIIEVEVNLSPAGRAAS